VGLRKGSLIMSKQTLISWLEQPKNYINLYQTIIAGANPTILEKLLGIINLTNIANQRRIQRIKKHLTEMEKKQQEASDILQEVIEFTSKQQQNANQENKLCIGDTMRLEEEIEIQKSKVKIVIKSCQNTIKYIKLTSNLPSNYLDWTWMHLDAIYTDPNIKTETRIRHQERWRLVLEEIENEKMIATKLRSAEVCGRLSSISEQLYNQTLNSAKREHVLINERFGLLKLMIEMGDVSKINNFFGEKVHGSSLDEFASEIKQMEFKVNDIKKT
jgi:hypothetical protein